MRIDKLSQLLTEVIYDTVIIGLNNDVLTCDIYGDYHYRYTYEPKDIKKIYTVLGELGVRNIICRDYKRDLLKRHFALDKIYI